MVKATVIPSKIKALDDIEDVGTITEAQGQIIYHNGTEWTALNAGTANEVLKTAGAGANPSWTAQVGALTKTADTVVSGSAVTSIDFTGLDLDAAKAYFIVVRLMNASATSRSVSMYFNNDTTATNYYEQLIDGDGSTAAAARANNAVVQTMPVSESSTGFYVIAREVGKVKTIGMMTNNDGSALSIQNHSHVWDVTATNVTRITFTSAGADTIEVGSRIMIFSVT